MPAIPSGGGDDRTPTAVRLLRVKEDTQHIVRFLDDKYQSMWTHYLDGGSVRCYPEDCPSCKKRMKKQAKGYAPVEEWSASKRLWYPFVLEVTEALDHLLRPEQLRGQIWELTRPERKGSKPTPVSGKLLRQGFVEGLSDKFDVKPTLVAIFGPGRFWLTWDKLSPDRVLLAPVEGPPPMFGPSPEQQRQEEYQAQLEAGRRQRALEDLHRAKSRIGRPAANGPAANGPAGNGPAGNGSDAEH